MARYLHIVPSDILFLCMIIKLFYVLQTFGNRILGVMAWLMPLSVAISTFGSANGTLFAAGRLCFAASREGHLLDCLSYVHVRRFTPAPGLIFHSLVAGITQCKRFDRLDCFGWNNCVF